MTKSSMSTESASLNNKKSFSKKERLLQYKMLATAFSYPDDNLFKFYPAALTEKEKLKREYDKLFRTNEIWLYATEYMAKNEFQRGDYLSDISGFYRAFGLVPDKDRPDSLSSELEFMYYLILKEDRAPDKEKALICHDAQKNFFCEYLYLAAGKIAQKIISHTSNDFYLEAAGDLLEFLESEKKVFE